MSANTLRWEPLGGGIGLWTSDAHRFGEDALLLARFAAPRARDRFACDLGAGCGIVSLLWCRDSAAPPHITAVERSEEACALLRRSVAENGLESRILPVCADLRAPHEALAAGRFDLVCMNPPYFPLGRGAQSKNPERRAARHEVECTLAQAAACASRLLRAGGRFCVCCRPERLCELFAALREAGLEPKRMQLAASGPEAAPRLVLCEARKGARPGLAALPCLFGSAEKGEKAR